MVNAESARQALDNLEEPFERARVALAPSVASVRDGVQHTDRALKDVVRAHPLWTLAGATMAGFLVGRLISRR